MAHSARLPDLDDETESPVRQALAAVGAAIGRNPAAAAGTTAFLVALAYVSANALWYQPHFHRGAFFETRIVSQEAVDAATQAASPRAAMQARDPKVLEAQQRLAELGLYGGEVDGRNGPATRKAIETYQGVNGLPVTGLLDSRTRARLGEDDRTAAIESEAASVEELLPEPSPANAGDASANRIRKVQAGLKAFGNEGIEIDGVAGAKTRAAIREFQTLFGLPVSGAPDDTLYAKMQEIGLMQ